MGKKVAKIAVGGKIRKDLDIFLSKGLISERIEK